MRGGEVLIGGVVLSPKAAAGLRFVLRRLDVMRDLDRHLPPGPRYEEIRVETDEGLRAILADPRQTETAKHPEPKLDGHSEEMTVQQAADLLDVTPQYVRQLCARGVLDGHQKHRGARWQIAAVSVRALLTATQPERTKP